jgi:hypothetical protein
METNVVSGFDMPGVRNETWGTRRIWGLQLAVYALAISRIIMELDQIQPSMRLI